MANVILSFYILPQKIFIPRINYRHIPRKDEYKWYIMVSNILHTMQERYHPLVLNLTRGENYNYMNTFETLMKGIGSYRVLQDNGLCLDLKGDTIFDVAQAYRIYLNNRLYSMYINILL
jgi:hypothetical protein